MEEILRNYMINELGRSKENVKMRYDDFMNQPDIFAEFIEWIKTRKYKTDNPICIEGYTAEKLAEEFNLKPISAYGFLIMLREDPEYTLYELKNGLRRK